MGFPSVSLEGVYRNHLKSIKRFFDTRHPKSYKIYVRRWDDGLLWEAGCDRGGDGWE